VSRKGPRSILFTFYLALISSVISVSRTHTPNSVSILRYITYAPDWHNLKFPFYKHHFSSNLRQSACSLVHNTAAQYGVCEHFILTNTRDRKEAVPMSIAAHGLFKPPHAEHRLKTNFTARYGLAARQTHRGGQAASWNVRWWGQEVSTLHTITAPNPKCPPPSLRRRTENRKVGPAIPLVIQCYTLII
jgi:hypothetical protein